MSAQELRQDIRTSLKLTASLTQSIKTLQLSSHELEEYISTQILENPFLLAGEIDDFKIKKELYDKKASIKTFDSFYSSVDHLESEVSLSEHLLQQVSYVVNDDKDKIIAAYITDLLDENGYLTTTIAEISSTLRVSENKIAEVLEKLHTLGPTGVYARNLSECLKLQLIDKNLYNNTYKIILDNLELVASRNMSKLSKLCSTSDEVINNCLENIRKLEPKPGRNFTSKNVLLKIPDVFIFRDETGEIAVSGNSEAAPLVQVNQEYYDKVKNEVKELDGKNYVSEMIKTAQNLIKSVDMREKTIILVARAIAEEQKEFFKRGIMYLKPLTLSRIASITGHDESTISRATSNKYAATPYGVLEMKYFFSSGVKSKYSTIEVSSHKVKEIIRALITEEDKKNPLSDEKIAEALKQFNIIAARRTVAKYREAINIETAGQRKRAYAF